MSSKEHSFEVDAPNKGNVRFIISFCNQVSSPDCSLCIFDTSDNTSQWISFSEIPDDFRNGFAGVCGICPMGDDVLITTQGQSPVIATISLSESKVTNYIVLKFCKDPHSLIFLGDYVYVISTGTNEIYRLAYKEGQFGDEELFWQYPEVGYDIDEVHLNGLTLDGEKLIASCFGPKNQEDSWGTEGRIFYVESGQSIHSGLNQPHSPIVLNDRMVFAESAACKVYFYIKSKDSSWKFENEFSFKGYTRGLIFKGKYLWVGVSASRELSRSRGEFLYQGSEQNSELLSIDLTTGKLDSSYSMSSYGREIYDLFEVKEKTDLIAESESISMRVRNMESWTDRYMADIGSLAQLTLKYKVNSTDLVSVIIPTYNRSHLIEESIRSVLKQTYTNLEVIVVDDGSTDNTEEVIASIKDDRVHYIKQINRGRSNARNHALSYAKGRYITFLDSDDLFLPDKIELQVNYLNNHPGTGMVYTSAYCINEQGERIEHKYLASVSGLIYESIAFFTPVTITLPTVMTYKEVMDSVGGFDEKMQRFEDTDMWRRISKLYRIDAMPEFTCLLRTHEHNDLLNQNPKEIIAALNYYAQKINTDDRQYSYETRRKGLASLYQYYTHALSVVPEFADEGQRLKKIGRKYVTWDARLKYYVYQVKVALHPLKKYRMVKYLHEMYCKKFRRDTIINK